MRAQQVTRVVNMLNGPQQRLVLWLACNHKLSLTALEVTLMSTGDLEALMGRHAQAMCPHCPDPAPADVQQAKSARQLWREAGEP